MRLKHIGRILGAIVLVIMVVIAVMLVKTLTYPFNKAPAKQIATAATPFEEITLQRLSGGLRIPTVSQTHPTPDNMRPFDDFKTYLAEVYPHIYSTMQTSEVNTYGLVFRWPGRDRALKPLLITAHYDVAPAPGYDINQADTFGAPVFRPDGNIAAPSINFRRHGNSRLFPARWPTAAFTGAARWTIKRNCSPFWKRPKP